MVKLKPGHRLSEPRGGPAVLGERPWEVTMGSGIESAPTGPVPVNITPPEVVVVG